MHRKVREGPSEEVTFELRLDKEGRTSHRKSRRKVFQAEGTAYTPERPSSAGKKRRAGPMANPQ